MFLAFVAGGAPPVGWFTEAIAWGSVLTKVLTLMYARKNNRASTAMESKSYNAAWSKIGNSSGFRLENSFFKDYPQFAGSSGEVQVVSSNTLILHLQTNEVEEQEHAELLLNLFLDFLMENALRNPQQEIEAYTEEMSAEDDDLTKGVVLDS